VESSNTIEPSEKTQGKMKKIKKAVDKEWNYLYIKQALRESNDMHL